MFLLLPILLLLVRNATFGRLFSTTKYGSATFDINSDHQSIIAIIIPKKVPSKNPTNVSYVVTHTCFNRLSENRLINVSYIWLGLLVMKLSIIS